MIQSLIKNEDAPLTRCGLPSISSELEWLPQLFVSGGLADLELGPFARNIMGGREAAKELNRPINVYRLNLSKNMLNFIRSNCQRNNYKLF